MSDVLTQAPLPSWGNLCRVPLRGPASDADLAGPWYREGEIAGWLSRSAWSLALIAQWRRSRAPGPVTVWIPDLFCNTSLVPMRQTGATLVFYPLTDTMVPDMAACRALAEVAPPQLFVLVHYFGQPTSGVAVRDFCAHQGAWLIEDAAHVLRPVKGVGVYGDFVLYSPHKHVPIPDGAVLVVRANGPGQLEADGIASLGSPDSWPGQLRDLQRALGCPQNSGRTRSMVWLVKRVLQKLGIRRRYPLETPFAEPLNLRSVASLDLAAPSRSGLAARLLTGVVAALAAEARQRQRLELVWDALLLSGSGSDPDVFPAGRSTNREWTPYLAAYRIAPATAEATYDQWQRQGLPVTTWPDLPPEVTRQRDANAWHLRHSRLYLPVHQSLSTRGMLRCRLPQAVQQSQPRLRWEWDRATRVQWQQWVKQAGRSNMLQTWAYGEAKSDQSGWRVKRGVLYRDEEPVAVVQVLQKRVAGLFAVARVNRGPLFLTVLLPHEQRAVWRELAQLGAFWRGRVLTVAPDLSLSGSSLALLAELGYRQFSSIASESVWVELDLELAVLRKRLDRKWRNMLTVSEKAGLMLEIGSGGGLFDWMLARYEELVHERNLKGAPVSFLRNLRKHLGDESPLLILRAVHEGEPVAGICVSRHGAAATYLLGWNGPKGRSLRANQYLLWQAIVHLKQDGLHWFDLGGISEDNTPSIAAFKLGLNGERYELVGEYWKW